jgi:oligopeptide/dipeptide ABC transporter ATP-binding protein
MELAGRETLFRRPLHPYTVCLLSAVPIPDPAIESRRRRIVLPGETPTLGEHVRGCPFSRRCPVGRNREICTTERPPLVEREPDHWVACHFPGELSADDVRPTRAATLPSP